MKRYQLKHILNKIKPYLKNIINDLKKSDAQKIQLPLAINFVSSKDNDEERAMRSKSDNIEIMIDEKIDEAIEKLFESLLSN